MMMMKKYRTRSVTLEERKAALWSRLPTELMVNILSRLPLKTIIHCRCVCKTWRNILLDPYFAKQHPIAVDLLLFTDIEEWTSVPTPRDFYLCGINAGRTHEHGNNAVVKFNTKFNLPYSSSQVHVVGSCNGLLCLLKIRSYICSSQLFICNPITGEYIILDHGISFDAYKFGYSSKTNQYKVIQINKRWAVNQPSKGEVYALGTDTWRSIGDVPFPFYKDENGIPLNGSLHWIVESKFEICSFDVESEQVQSILSPFQSKVPYLWKLGVLRNCLCLFNEDSSGLRLDIWMMKDYGVKESWSKDYVIKTPSHVPLTPITMQEDGSILMLRNYDALVLYNPRRKTFRRIKIDGIPSNFVFESTLHLPRFLSLKDICNGDGSKILNVKS